MIARRTIVLRVRKAREGKRRTDKQARAGAGAGAAAAAAATTKAASAEQEAEKEEKGKMFAKNQIANCAHTFPRNVQLPPRTRAPKGDQAHGRLIHLMDGAQRKWRTNIQWKDLNYFVDKLCRRNRGWK